MALETETLVVLRGGFKVAVCNEKLGAVVTSTLTCQGSYCHALLHVIYVHGGNGCDAILCMHNQLQAAIAVKTEGCHPLDW